MKKLLLGLTCWLLASSLPGLAAPTIGDSYEAVIAAKGHPTGKVEAGDQTILNYPDVTITIRNGKVAKLKATGTGAATTIVPERKVAPAEHRVAAPTPALATAAGISAATWTHDVPAALTQARADNRRVFLFFTGSDWCGWCIRLQREILSKPEFADYARDHLVLVELDFPQRKPQSASERAANEKLAKKYGVRGFPTVIILDGSGRKVGQLGYQDGGPKPFIAALGRM